jgi:hypothetical protein
MFLTGIVSDPSNAATTDGTSATVNIGRANEALVAELHGKYFTQNYRGNVFIGSTSTTGVVIPIATTKAPVYTIWNPAGSGKLCVPLTTLISYNATTAVLGGLIWTATTNAGSQVGATAPIVTFSAQATPISANLGAGKGSQMKFANDASTVSITAAASFYRDTGVTVTATTVGAIISGWQWRDDWDGTGIIPPGNAIHLMGSTAVALTAVISTVWAEIPL